MADDLKKQQSALDPGSLATGGTQEERPQDELQDEQLSKVNGGGSSFWEEFLRVFSGDSG